jgi:DNA repair exonuclease SbcCD nuclease subunit
MKVIGIAFSDLHYANWQQHNPNNERLEITFRATERIIRASIKHSCPILFPGDLVDHPKHLDNIVMKYLAKTSTELWTTRTEIIGINGNHDFDARNSFKNPQEGYFTHLSKMNAPFRCVDFSHIDTPHYRVHGIPYINDNVDFIEALEDRIKNLHKTKGNVLLIHRDLAGAVEPNGSVIEKDPEKDKQLKLLFKKFNLVLSGHIHKPQLIPKLGKHVYMLGSTNQQRRSDAGCKMGYWKIYEDYTADFIQLKLPEFQYAEHDEEVDIESNPNFIIRLPKEEKSLDEVQGESTTFTTTENRLQLARKYLEVKGVKSKRKLKTLMKYI